MFKPVWKPIHDVNFDDLEDGFYLLFGPPLAGLKNPFHAAEKMSYLWLIAGRHYTDNKGVLAAFTHYALIAKKNELQGP